MRLYVAGPYGNNSPEHVIADNVAKADQMARDLAMRGHLVFCPNKMFWGWEKDKRLSGRAWWLMDIDMLLYWAEAVIRIPGESDGSDIEEAIARKIGLPVFTNLEDVPLGLR